MIQPRSRTYKAHKVGGSGIESGTLVEVTGEREQTGTAWQRAEFPAANLGLDDVRALPWATEGKCVGNPTPWIEGTIEAYRGCAACPVLEPCTAWSLTAEAKRTGMVVAGKHPEKQDWDESVRDGYLHIAPDDVKSAFEQAREMNAKTL